MNEHEHEPVWGLPEYLPEGEKMLWQGQPAWQQLALHVFHVRKIAIYFVLLCIAHIGLQWTDGASLAVAAKGAFWLIALGAAAIAILALMSRLYSNTTIYTVTNQRLVLRFGVAVPMMINIPWEKVDEVGLLRRADGSGDIIFTLASDRKMSYWLLWPHAKPWRFSPVRPALRGLTVVDEVAERVRQAIANQPDSVVSPITLSPTSGTPEAVNPATHTAAFS